jgi:alpha-beta hydrolase superfamily lysophospholipase
VGAISAGEDYILHHGTNERFDGRTKLIVATHGHGGSAAHLQQNAQFNGRPLFAAVASGRYMVLGINAAGPATFGNQTSVDSIGTAVTYAVARGARAGKYALCGYSMGGGVALNRVKQDYANISGALLYAPLSDLDWAYNTVGHTPVSGSGVYPGEIDTAFGSYAATAGFRIWDEPASFRHGVPILIAHATDDATVPYSLSTSFVSNVNQPYVTVRSPAITGGHTGLFANIPDSDVVSFFDSLSW